MMSDPLTVSLNNLSLPPSTCHIGDIYVDLASNGYKCVANNTWTLTQPNKLIELNLNFLCGMVAGAIFMLLLICLLNWGSSE